MKNKKNKILLKLKTIINFALS